MSGIVRRALLRRGQLSRNVREQVPLMSPDVSGQKTSKGEALRPEPAWSVGCAVSSVASVVSRR